jgi:hypothetical protein
VTSFVNLPRLSIWIAAPVRACVAAILLVITSSMAHAAETTPTDMLQGIYREAVKGVTSDWLEPKRRSKFLSQSLLALWAKSDAKRSPEGDASLFDFDLTTDTNGLELQGFAIKIVRENPDAAILAVKLSYRKPYYRPGPPAVVTYDFVREEGRWRIDNIRTTDWSVRDILTQWLGDS